VRSKAVYGLALVLSIFLLSGGIIAVNHYILGSPITNMEARFLVSSPFFAGFLFLGTMGLIEMRKYAKDKARVMVSMVYVVFSYAGIEVLFRAVGR
jgi:hypothetical protein